MSAAELQAAILRLQDSQRETLAQLVRVARRATKREADALAERIVQNWTEAALAMLVVIDLATTPVADDVPPH